MLGPLHGSLMLELEDVLKLGRSGVASPSRIQVMDCADNSDHGITTSLLHEATKYIDTGYRFKIWLH